MIVYSSYAKVGHPQAPILKRPQHYRVEAFFITKNKVELDIKKASLQEAFLLRKLFN
jgi:hypothetical protein